MNDQQLTRTALLWQLLSVVIVTLPHISHLPYWITLVVILCIVWRLMVYLGRWSLPPKWLKTCLVLAAGVGVLASYKEGGGISVTVALLVVGFGLKVIELYHRRDSLIVLYVAYLVASTIFLFSQSVGTAIYVILAIIIVTSALMSTNLSRETGFIYPLKRSVLMLIPAFPLMVVLFIGMPRLGPLWEVGLDKSAAKTGLADTMTPGDITRLTRSAEVAFRVRFDGDVPDQTQLYWRSIVLSDFDGRGWLKDEEKVPKLPRNRDIKETGTFQYEVILESNQRNYIPVLDYLSAWPSELNAYADMTLASKTKIVNREQYKISSRLDRGFGLDKTADDFAKELHIPLGNNEAKRLASSWWQESATPQAFIDKMKQYYHQNFNYSLTPPPLGDDSISEFLFETKTGFCGHFASASAFLLRSVGIPARVVTGYQGGEWNPYENYFLVRQYDAHAWIEAWFPEQGWVRMDPTAWVAPDRVEKPADDVLSKDNAFLQDNLLSAWSISNNQILMQIRHRIEALNYGWHRWVLNYHHQQKGLLEHLLGALSPLKLALFLLIPFSLVISLTLLLLNYKKKRSANPSDNMINALSAYFAKEDMARRTGETVTHYCDRLAQYKPEYAESFIRVSTLYEDIEYGQVCDAHRLTQLKQEIGYCLNVNKNLLVRLQWFLT